MKVKIFYNWPFGSMPFLCNQLKSSTALEILVQKFLRQRAWLKQRIFESTSYSSTDFESLQKSPINNFSSHAHWLNQLLIEVWKKLIFHLSSLRLMIP